MSRNQNRSDPNLWGTQDPGGLLSWQSIAEEADAAKQKSRRRRGQNRHEGGYSATELAEPFLTAGSAMAGSAAGGTAGLAVGLLDAARGGKDPVAAGNAVMGEVTDALTYLPRTARGQENLQSGLDWMDNNSVLNAIESGQQFLGDTAMEATGSPAAATAAFMAPDIVETLLGLGPARKSARAASRALEAIEPTGSRAAKMGGNQAGSIGGVNAKGINPMMKRVANDMRDQGYSKENIWKVTGGHYNQPAWFDSEGKLKWEFDDSKAGLLDKPRTFEDELGALDGRTRDAKRLKAINNLYDNRSYTDRQEFKALKEKHGMLDDYNTLAAHMDHPEMARNYPLNMEMGYSEPNYLGGAYGEYDRRKNAMKVLREKAGDPDFKRSVILHEATHGAQTREGHPRGGGTEEFEQELQQYSMQIKRAEQQMANIRAKMETASPSDYNRLSDDHYNLAEKRDRWQESLDKKPSAFESYESLMGEADARAVQTRRDLTMEQRLARPFWLDYDKGGALDKQHVRY